MSKTPREKDSAGTPNYVMLSVLFALLVFALEGLKESIGFGQEQVSLRLINLAFVGVGLALCFFWRRFPESPLKQATALIFTIALWVFLFLMAVGPLLFQEDSGKIVVIHQIGYTGLLLSGLGLMANLFYDTRLAPSLMLATIAGLVTSLGSVWGLVPHGLHPRSPHDVSESTREEGVIRSSEFAAQGETHASAEGVHSPDAAERGDKLEAETLSWADSARSPRHSDEHHDRDEPSAHSAEAEEGEDSLAAIQEKARAKARAQQEKARHKAKTSPAPAKGKLMARAHEDTKKHEGTKKHETTPHKAAHWEYVGASGPEAWGKLDASFHLCATGQQQSPIDIPTQWPLTQDIDLHYRLSSFEVVDNGHTVRYKVEGGNVMVLNGKRYELKQIHFHTPSEHFVAGRSAILEAHFVHASATGELAVIGSLIEAGLMHREYQKIWEYMPHSKNAPVKPRGKTFDPRELLPRDLSVYRYAGSLTTPPCSEKVVWSVLKEPVQMSQEQINRLRAKYRNNARPIQSLNARP